MSSEATGLVRVKSTPKGEAPQEIRAAWVGLNLPCYPVAGYIPGEEVGVGSGKKEAWQPRQCVIVPRKEAFAVLEAERPDAARWWKQNAIPGDNLCFGLDEVEIVSGVRMQRIIEVTDEMRGDPYR